MLATSGALQQALLWKLDSGDLGCCQISRAGAAAGFAILSEPWCVAGAVISELAVISGGAEEKHGVTLGLGERA